MIIPSIDLMDGKAVQLKQGKEKVLERADVFELLEEFSLYGEVAIIDLDAALGKGSNKELIKKLLKKQPCRVGGGIRDLETAREYIKAGASKIIIGTQCREQWVQKIDPQFLIFAIDAKGDYWATRGWQETENITVLDLIPELQSNCSEFLYTQVEKEGMLGGIDKERIAAVIKASKVQVTIAGGITDLEDIQWFSKRGANGQIGMSIYTGKLSLDDCFIAQVDFDKLAMMPTVVQDVKTKQVLMMAYSNIESLTAALQKRKGIYWSRSRDELWEKGLTSGNGQDLISVDIDCDGDTLLFQVDQSGSACHFDRYSCFVRQQPSFDLKQLEQLLLKRKQLMPEGSFSTKLFQSAEFRAEKIREEAEELIEAQDYEDVRWEAADLLFFALTDALAKGVSLEQIQQELGGRFNDR